MFLWKGNICVSDTSVRFEQFFLNKHSLLSSSHTFLILFLFNAIEFSPRATIGYHEPNGNGPGILMAVLVVGICLNIAYIVVYLNLDSILL